MASRQQNTLYPSVLTRSCSLTRGPCPKSVIYLAPESWLGLLGPSGDTDLSLPRPLLCIFLNLPSPSGYFTPAQALWPIQRLGCFCRFKAGS